MDDHALRNEVARMRSALQLIRMSVTKPNFSEDDRLNILFFVQEGLKGQDTFQDEGTGLTEYTTIN